MKHLKYRPDIDGLRAIAVLSVVVFHAFPTMLTGGFVGVDIFFVISGFLISSIILGSLQLNNFSFIEFYSRRIKRIFPALVLVLFACFAMGGFLLLADEYQQLGQHIAGGAGFVSNFILWQEVGYFDNSADSKPLLHLWSLGIEEQFYIVWPLLLYLAWKWKIGLFWPIVIGAIASFSVNLGTVGGDPEAAFYSPLSRFWELMAGSYLAYLKLHPPHFARTGNGLYSNLAGVLRGADRAALANAASVIGMVLIAAAIFLLNKSERFPGWWALLPVLGTVLILAAGSGAWVNRYVMTRRVMILVGLVSYPFYLWHWPLLSFARIVEGGSPLFHVRVLVVIVSFVLAWGTYKLVETPIRFHTRKKTVVVVLVMLMSGMGFTGYKVYVNDGLKYRLSNLSRGEDPFISPKKKLKKERSFCKNSHPEMTGICFSSLAASPKTGETIFFVGDSHSESLSTGFIESYPAIPSMSFGMFGCLPFVEVERFINGKPIGCSGAMQRAFSYIAQQSSGTIVLTSRYSLYLTGTGYGNASVNEPEDSHIQYPGESIRDQVDYREVFAHGMRSTLKLLSGQNKRIVFVHQVPELGFDPKMCVDRPFRSHSIKSCRLDRSEVEKRQRAYRQVVASVLAEFPQVRVFDPMNFLCDENYCHVRKDGAILYRDDDHVSLAGGGVLSAELKKLIHDSTM